MHIIVFRDSPDEAEISCTRLKEHGFDVSVFESLEEFQRFNKKQTDAVILDISNSQSHGLDLYVRLKYVAGDLPIILFSVHRDRETALEFMRMGAQDYLIKGLSGWESFERRINFAVERHHHQRIQLNAELRMRMLLEQSFDAFIVIDNRWRITSWNAIAEQTFGWTQDEAIGESLALIVPFHLQNLFMKKLKLPQGRLGGKNFKTLTELVLKHRLGKTFSAELGIIPVGNDPGSFCVFVRDISKQKEFNEELERLVLERTEKLSISNDELKQFAKIASHDLQEPLRAVKGFADLLLKDTQGKLDQNCEEFVGYILEGIDRMTQLIQSILTHAQLSQTPDIEQVTDCNSMLIEVLSNMRSAIEESDTSFDVENLPNVAVERSQMIQLFQNLISNSIKYRNTKAPQISISAEKIVDQWLFTYRDNGTGIESCYSEKVFEMFSRLHPKGKYPGTGMGLAICKRIVTNHGGSIWVESGVEDGSVFMFTLPIPKKKRKEGLNKIVRKKMTDSERKKIEILLVEDTPSDVRLTQEALKRSQLDYDMTIVGDGVEALEYLNNLKEVPDGKLPQVILLDLNMPRKNGHELLEDINADPVLRAIPVVLLTVSEREEDVVEALFSKMNYYLAKPVTSEKLCTLMKTLHELYTNDYADNGSHTAEESHIRLVLAGNPHTALHALAKLCNDSNERVRSRVAENSRINSELQLKLAIDPQASVRISLCDNENLSSEVIALLLKDTDHDVRLALTNAPAVSEDTLQILCADENVFVSDSAKKALARLQASTPTAAD